MFIIVCVTLCVCVCVCVCVCRVEVFDVFKDMSQTFDQDQRPFTFETVKGFMEKITAKVLGKLRLQLIALKSDALNPVSIRCSQVCKSTNTRRSIPHCLLQRRPCADDEARPASIRFQRTRTRTRTRIHTHTHTPRLLLPIPQAATNGTTASLITGDAAKEMMKHGSVSRVCMCE